MKNAVYTIGHSTRSIEDFINLMKIYKIETVVDVRKIAKSRHNPQFSQDALSKSLGEYHISYVRLEGLGGLRHTTKESINTAWENLSFRGYADYMQSPEFVSSLTQLINIAGAKQTVIMCAEAVPWRCHRSLIGDALVIRNIAVEDIISEKSCKPHKLTSFAHVVGNTIIYSKVEKEKKADWAKEQTERMTIQKGDCVEIPDGRIARVREIEEGRYKVRVRRTTSKSHQFLVFTKEELTVVNCPKGWMSPEGYNRYLQVTLAKMRVRKNAAKRKSQHE